MKKKLLTVLLALVSFTFVAQAQFATTNNNSTSPPPGQPIESPSSNPDWYFIQNPQSGNVMELQGTTEGSLITAKARPLLTNNDGQLWRFERVNTAGVITYKIYNKLGAGSIGSTGTWSTSDQSFTISPVDVGFYAWTIKNGSNFIIAANASADQTVGNTTTYAAATCRWRFHKAPTASTAGSPVYYQMQSCRTDANYFLSINTSSPYGIQSTATNTFAQTTPGLLADQLWRIEYDAVNLGYKLVNKAREVAAPGETMSLTGAMETDANVTSGLASTTFVLSPKANAAGGLLVYVKGSNTTVPPTNTGTYNEFFFNATGTARLAAKTVDEINGQFKFNTQHDFDIATLVAKIIEAEKVYFNKTAATTTYFTQAAYDNLRTAIETARAACATVTNAAQANAAATALSTVTKTLATANIEFSTEGVKEVYYTIYTPQRPASSPYAALTDIATPGNGDVTSTGIACSVASSITTITGTPTAAQKWMFQALPNGEFTLVNPTTGNHLSTAQYPYNVFTAGNGARVTSTPVTSNGWSLIPSSFSTGNDAGTLVVFKNDKVKSSNNSNYLQLNASSSAFPTIVGNWGGGTDGFSWTTADAGSSYKIVKVGEKLAKDILLDKISFATALKSSTTEGNAVGQYTTYSKGQLQAAIDAAQGIYDNGSVPADYTAAYTALKLALSTYSASMNAVTYSTVGSPVYYYVKNVATSKYVSSIGLTAADFVRCAPKDGTSGGEFWIFQLTGTANGVKIISAEQPTLGLKVTADNSYVEFSPLNDATEFSIQMSGSNYLILPTNVSSYLNIDNVNNILYTYNNAGDANSKWMFEDVNTIYSRARTLTRALYNASVGGTDFGQYPASNRINFDAAIALEEAKTPSAMNANELITGITTLNNAATAYKAAINLDLNSLLASNSANYRWYWIRSNATNTNTAYCFGKVMSQGTRAVAAKFTYEPKVDPSPSDAQLFRFELNAGNTALLNIVNKLGTYVAADGAIATVSTAGNEFSLNLLTDAVSFTIKPTTLATLHAQESGSHIVNWDGIAGSASSWVFDFAMETSKSGTSLSNNSELKLTVYEQKGRIHISSPNAKQLDIAVYSITGQNLYRAASNQSTVVLDKNFAAGAYFVKVNQTVTKVIVR